MLERLRSLLPLGGPKGDFSTPEKMAAATLPDIQEPKVKGGQQAVPSAIKRTRTTRGELKMAQTDRRVANSDMLTLRNGTSTKSTVHDLAAVSPDLSSSNWAYARLVVTRNFTAIGYNLDGTISPEGTQLVQQLLARFNYLTDYTDGFSGMSSVHAMSEAWVKELRLYGAIAAELVLDKARVPNRVQPISSSQVEFVDDGTGYVYPIQKANGEEIPLDIPTFFYEALDQDLLTAYADSPLEAAVQAVLADAEFTNDTRRTIKRALHPRLDATIQTEQYRKMIPLDVQNDPTKEAQFLRDYMSQVEDTVNGLEPDDALVHMDVIKFDYLNNGNVTLNKEWDVLQGFINAKTASGAKAPPAVLGHGAGSQNIASTETALFLRYCEGVQNKINSMLSRILTLGARLLGQDIYVKFEFERVDLRPESELEAFRTMRQSRILDLLSLGFISDEEASLQLTGSLPPAGAPKLSGTMFRGGGSSANSDANPNSNTSVDTTGPRDSKPATPTQPKGPVQRVK